VLLVYSCHRNRLGTSFKMIVCVNKFNLGPSDEFVYVLTSFGSEFVNYFVICRQFAVQLV
jgi:hypothetical protein